MATTNIFDSSAASLPGQRATETAHRKIELQSPADLQYLIANVSRAAREKIDKHFPPEAAPESGEDDMRKRVEVLVDEYIRRTFAAAKDGMSINGMDSGEMEREMEKAREGEGWFIYGTGMMVLKAVADMSSVEIEPFDTKLAQRVQALSAQIENQTLQLANLRRNAPAETAKRFQDSFAQQSEDFDARLKKHEEADMAAAKESKLDVGEIERLDEVQGTWQKGTEELDELKTRMGGTVAKMERAQKAVDFVEGKE